VDATYEFSGDLWEWGGKATWVFVTLPPELADQIADRVPHKGGFGSVKVRVRIGETEWSTSLFPDKSAGSYVLPIKQAVRRSEQLTIGDTADLAVTIAGS
jgi:hypothetical protein